MTREFPILAKQIQKKYLYTYQIHEPFELVNPLDYQKNHGVLNYHPNQKIPEIAYFPVPRTMTHRFTHQITESTNGLSPLGDYQTPYKINCIYGVFSEKSLIYNKNNFIFTLVDHPIDTIYNCFYYLKWATAKTEYRRDLTTNVLEEIDRQTVAMEVLGEAFNIKIEEFIDMVLDNGLPNFHYLFKGIRYRHIKEMFRIGNLSKYNHVIFKESLDKGLEKLNFFLKTRFDCPKINSRIIGDCSYRRKELASFLEEDIAHYNYHKEIY